MAAYDRRGGHGDLAESIALLRTWNGQMDKDKPEPLIMSLMYPAFPESGGGCGIAWQRRSLRNPNRASGH